MEAKINPVLKSGMLFTVCVIGIAVLYSYIREKEFGYSIIMGSADSIARLFLKRHFDGELRIARYSMYIMIVALVPLGRRFWTDLSAIILETNKVLLVFIIPFIIAGIIMEFL